MITTSFGKWLSFNEFETIDGEVLFVKPYSYLRDTLPSNFPFYAFLNLRDCDTIISYYILSEEEYLEVMKLIKD